MKNMWRIVCLLVMNSIGWYFYIERIEWFWMYYIKIGVEEGNKKLWDVVGCLGILDVYV